MVIQRLQNLYLLLSAIIVTVCVCSLSSMSVVALILGILAAVLPLVTIAKFKNLKLQKSLTVVCLISKLGWVAYMLINAYVKNAIANFAGIEYYLIGVAILVSMILDVLAHRGIKHDMKLLNDSYRLR